MKYFIYLLGLFAVSDTIAQTPNVLFIISDDLRAQLGCYAYENIHSPHIDTLAREGFLFEQAFAQQAICNPSRTSFLTGKRPNSTKVIENRAHFRGNNPEIITLPQYFKQNGYHTQAFGKIFHNQLLDDIESWTTPSTEFDYPEYGPLYQLTYDYVKDISDKLGIHDKRYIKRDPQTHHPIKEMREGSSFNWMSWEAAPVKDSYLPDGRVAEASITALESLANDKETPFFLAVGFHKPHLPYVAPAKYFQYYPFSQFDLTRYKAPQNAPKYAFHDMDELREYVDIPDKGPIPLVKQQQLISAYFAGVSYIDAQIGLLIAALKRLNIYDNTIIVLVGDHGYHLGDFNLWGKQTNFDWATRAPLLIKPAFSKSSYKVNTLVEFVDIYPSLCKLAGLKVPDQLDGKSFEEVFQDSTYQHKEVACSQYPRRRGKVMGYSVRTKEFRYTQWIDTNTKDILSEELYDYKKSIIEVENVVEHQSYQSTRKKMKETLAAAFPESKLTTD
ncbi:MAG: sulfatase [Thermonemataceae bacterium]